MKYTTAIVLVAVTLVSAEPPRNNAFLARQTAAAPPYPANGYKPDGPVFNLPLRSQRQQQQPPTPAASYGPPPQEYGPPAEPTTTEVPTTTDSLETTTLEPQAESFRVRPTNEKLTAPQKTIQPNPAQLYVVVPQNENLVYASPLTSAKLVVQAPVQQPHLLPIQAVPAFAKIQEVPQRSVQQPRLLSIQAGPVFANNQEFAQAVKYQVIAPVAAVPVTLSAYTSIVNTPFSSSFVQSFQ